MKTSNHALTTMSLSLRKAWMPSLTGCALFIAGQGIGQAGPTHLVKLAMSAKPADPASQSQFNSLQHAASSDLADAQYRLAIRLLRGDGMKKDESAAMRWLRLAAEQGHMDAQFQLGLLYLDSETLPTNEDLAYRWINAAVESGHPSAGAVSQYMLSGEEYSLGC